MRCGLLAGLVLALVPGCADAGVTAEEYLHSRFSQAYAPLEQCVSSRVNGRTNAVLAAEFIANKQAPALEREARRLLNERNRDFVQATRSDVTEQRRIELLLKGLREFVLEHGNNEYGYRTYRMRRNVAAAIALAGLPSVGCDVAEDLRYLAREADYADVLINVATEYVPFQECNDREFASRVGFSEQIPQMIVDAKLLSKLDAMTRAYLDELPSRPADNLGSDEPDVRAAADQLAALMEFGSRWGDDYDEPYASQTQRLLAIVDTRRLVSEAARSPCVPSENLLSWMEIAKNANH